MKAVMIIELEMDGEWKKSDKDVLIEKISELPGSSCWEIDPERLLVLAKSWEIKLVGKP